MNIDLLKTLCETPGIAGNEERVRRIITHEIMHIDLDKFEFDTDPMGNLIVHKPGTGTKVQLLCHMDEIGFIVNYVSDEGFIHVQPLGGFDARNLFSRRVLVCTDDGDIKGVMNPAGLPVHLAKPEDRKNVPAPDEFMIDIGRGKDTKDFVKVGDWVVMDEPFLEMGENRLVSKALDNRIACWLGIETLRNYKGDADLYVVFTVQEEVGLRGAQTASHSIAPEITLGLDTTLACDTPGVPGRQTTSTLGEGVCVGIRDGSMIAHKETAKQLMSIADEREIPYQRKASAAGGQDAAAGQRAGNGSRAVNLAVGTRYIHTVTEMVDKRDLQAALDLTIAFLEEC